MMDKLIYPFGALLFGFLGWAALKPNREIIDLRGKLPTNGSYRNRSVSGITDITVHHTAGGNSETIQGIANYHTGNKGWPGIGYHFVIDRAGKIHQTNDLSARSYHNGHNNTVAIGIGLMGNFELMPPQPKQLSSLKWLIDSLKNNGELTSLYRCVGHNEYTGHTACPGRFFNMDGLRKSVNLQGVNAAPLAVFSAFNAGPAYDPTKADN